MKKSCYAEEPIAALIFFLFSGCTLDAFKLEDFLSENYEGRRVLSVVNPDMSNDHEEEYVDFLEDPELTRLDGGGIPMVAEVLVILLSDTEQIFQPIKAKTLGYNEQELNRILSFKDEYGEWLGYCYLHDLNANGTDELITFSVSGTEKSR